MSTDGRKPIDVVTGIETTGHVWDDVRELNKPLPLWWVLVLWLTVIWSIGYWVVYPAWPLLTSHTHGMFGYSQRARLMEDVAAGKAAQAKFVSAIAASDLATIAKDPELSRFAAAGGRAIFGDNCAACHGRDAQGRKGFPSLQDDDWLWGGTLEDIATTVRFGIRSPHPQARQNQMPRFGLDTLLEPGQIDDAAEFVLSLSGRPTNSAAAERGKSLFADQCAACHGTDAKGKLDMGAPNLTDAIWLYGGSKADIVQSIGTGRGGVMPTWEGRLDDATIKQLAIYVHGLGGGK